MTKQQRALRTRRVLLEQAAQVFRESGYDQTTLGDIARRSGVSSGALYFHFDNKAALAAAVEEQASRALRVTAGRLARSGASALQTLIDTSHVLARLLREDTVVRAGFELNCEGHGSRGADLRQEWQVCVLRLLAVAARDGALKPGASCRLLASTVVAATVGFEVLGRTDPEWLSRYSLCGFWRLQIPQIARPDLGSGLDPAGTEAALLQVPGGSPDDDRPENRPEDPAEDLSVDLPPGQSD